MRLLPALAIGASLLLGGASASAFCRSTTCSGGDCPRDADGCKTTGAPLGWPGVCVGFSLQRNGTANLPANEVRDAIERSFATWSELPCDGGGQASILFAKLAEVSCRAAEYNKSGPNANVILFQDTQWKYNGPNDTLAKTTVTFDTDTGEIFDADIEINHAYNEFTTGDADVVYDLQSIVTHEIGHFLGIDHSPDPFATMFAEYDEGSIEQRTLESDDVAALCAIYPPSRSGKCDPTPLRGLADACQQGQETKVESDEGGCALAPPATNGTTPWRANAAAALLLLSALAARRARRPVKRPTC
jgi:hypothetical protein